jgi:hypothetical protein
MQPIQCEGCGQFVPGYDIVNYGSIERGYRTLCSACFNTEVAKLSGLTDFEHIRFEPMVMTDLSGNVHEFHFRPHWLGTHLILDAFELLEEQPSGYQFRVIGDPEGDLMGLLGKLIEKMRRALATKHIEDSEHGLQIADHQIVRGIIDWDVACEGRVPLLLIDGRPIAWEEFGRMLMSFRVYPDLWYTYIVQTHRVLKVCPDYVTAISSTVRWRCWIRPV